MNKVAIVGAGAMGTILGAYLNKNGCKAKLVDNYKEHVEALNEKGAKIIGTVEMTVPVCAKLPSQMEGIYDLIILFTKQMVNTQVLSNLMPHLDEHSVVLTLQNGIPEPFVEGIIGGNRTVGGAVLWGATFIEPGVSELTSKRMNDVLFDIGEIDGKVTPRIKEVAKILECMGSVEIVENIMEARWAKLVNNACMSGMSAYCGSTFGGIIENQKSKACLSYLGREVKKCCEAEGYTMPTLVFGFSPDSLDIKGEAQYNENQKMFADMYASLPDAKASMLQDLENGKVTEVSMINGYVVEIGEKHGIPTPFNKIVVEVVKKIEAGSLARSFDNLQYFKEEWFEYGL